MLPHAKLPVDRPRYGKKPSRRDLNLKQMKEIKTERKRERKERRPVLTTGQLFLHSWRHFFGLQRSELTMAIRVRRSDIVGSCVGLLLGLGLGLGLRPSDLLCLSLRVACADEEEERERERRREKNKRSPALVQRVHRPVTRGTLVRRGRRPDTWRPSSM